MAVYCKVPGLEPNVEGGSGLPLPATGEVAPLRSSEREDCLGHWVPRELDAHKPSGRGELQ